MSDIRASLYTDLVTVFPPGLMNTATSAALLGNKQARYLENILPSDNTAGAGKVRYGVRPLGDAIGGGVTILDEFEFRKSDGTLQNLAYCDDGSLRLLDEDLGTWSTVKSGLDPLGTMRSVQFAGYRVFVNGMDTPFKYDGTTCTDLGEYVDDTLATDYTYVDSNTITLKPGAGRSDYPDGRTIRVDFATTGEVIATVASTSYSSGTNTLTINVSGTPFVNEVIDSVEYFVNPPAFSDIYVEHNLLWALSPGELKAKDFRGADGFKVYYTDFPNNPDAWINQTGDEPTQELNFIDMRNKSARFDELVKISSFAGFMVFHARTQLFIYAGDDPSDPTNFTWQKTVQVGTVHGNLVQAFPSDLIFFTPYGARSLKSVFQSEALEVSPDIGSDIDPTINDMTMTLAGTDEAYKKARSFRYDAGGMYGFKLGDNRLLAYCLTEKQKGWAFLSGYFADASAFNALSDNRLIIARGDQLYVYANNADGEGFDYTDDGDPFFARWWCAWISPKGNRWKNNHWGLVMEESAEITVSLHRFKDWLESSRKTVTFELQPSAAVWDESPWEESYFDPTGSSKLRTRDNFICESFSFMIEAEVITGPVSFLGVRPIGG